MDATLSVYQITDRQRIGYNIPQAVVYSLMLLKMGKIVARNMSSYFGYINKPLMLHLVGLLLYHFIERKFRIFYSVKNQRMARYNNKRSKKSCLNRKTGRFSFTKSS